MGMVHQQFLHVLGLAGEHQRSDAGTHITVQSNNLNLDAAQISGIFINIKIIFIIFITCVDIDFDILQLIARKTC